MIGIAWEFVECSEKILKRRGRGELAEVAEKTESLPAYSMNAFMQNALPPDFSNSEVSTSTGVKPSLARICCRF
jgi:hypothetical protein